MSFGGSAVDGSWMSGMVGYVSCGGVVGAALGVLMYSSPN